MIGKRFRSLPFIFANDNYTLSRQYIYRWQRRYDGSWDSLRDLSRRPHHHPSQHTEFCLSLAFIFHLGYILLHIFFCTPYCFLRTGNFPRIIKKSKSQDFSPNPQIILLYMPFIYARYFSYVCLAFCFLLLPRILQLPRSPEVPREILRHCLPS